MRSGRAAENFLYDGETFIAFDTAYRAADLDAWHRLLVERGHHRCAGMRQVVADAVVDGKAYVYESIRTGVWVGEAASVLGTPARLPVEQVRVERVNNE